MPAAAAIELLGLKSTCMIEHHVSAITEDLQVPDKWKQCVVVGLHSSLANWMHLPPGVKFL